MAATKKRTTRSLRTQPAVRTQSPPAGDGGGARPRDWRLGLGIAALLLATLGAYCPAWRGGMIWDDESHVTKVALRSVEGLGRIWFELGATAQYYPLVHSAFWVQHRLWGDATLGYHLVNILLHVLSACLLLVILRRLDVPGAPLAALVFALHPVHVESVAWITELKNTLSGVFFLASALAYLRFDRERAWRTYGASAALFCLALLSKSVTATLPGALLVVFWWKRGRLDWRRDVVPLVPFVVVGAAAGLFTAWVERTYIEARGPEFDLTIVERGLVAGRVIWFYLSKLFWPADLVFVYPRWEVSQAVAWQYAYPLGVAALLAALWFLRTRTRAPLAAFLAFAGILFPVLGFLNVYPFRFSFVADHFQYLASIPVIALVSAGAATVASRRAPRAGGWALVGTLALAVTLGTLTWRQSRQYADALTLYRATIERNPSSWMAHGNLGALLRRTDPEQALVHLTAAVRLKPDLVEAQYNLATALQELGRLDEAVVQYGKTIELAPDHARAYCNLGNTLRQLGRLQEAERSFMEAIRLAPSLALAHSGLGRLLQMEGRLEEALRSCETAARLQPDFAAAHRDLAGVLQEQGRLEEAVGEYSVALRLQPGDAEVHNDVATALQQLGRFDQAIHHFREAARLAPQFSLPQSGLGATLRMVGRLDEARLACEAAVRLQPDVALAHYELANVLQGQRRYAEALDHYQTALQLQPGALEVHCALAVVLERLGRRAEGREHMTEALRLAPDAVTAHASMGSALEALGLLQAARAEFEQTLRLAPEFASGRLALDRIDVQLRLIPATTDPRPAVNAR
jgi:tetratricopeptide (TPR) repeat protein